MRILFTAVGKSDPVRGGYDAAMLHILRYYQPEKVYLLLTKRIQKDVKKDEKELKEVKNKIKNRYTYAIEDLERKLSKKSNRDIKFDCETIPLDVEDADDLDKLDIIREKFIEVLNDEKNKDAEWLINITSGTPQIQVVMSLQAIYYPQAKAIQVRDPFKEGDPRKHEYCNTIKAVRLQLNKNHDDNVDADRTSEPQLQLLRRHELIRQISSLVEHYEYRAAKGLVRDNRHLFSEEAELMLKYAYKRKDLNSKDANDCLNKINIDDTVKEQLKCKDNILEYFWVMELCQENGQLTEFILRLSPILTNLGVYYLNKIDESLLKDICEVGKDGYKILRKKVKNKDQDMLEYFDAPLRLGYLRDGYLNLELILNICNYLSIRKQKGNKKHEEICQAFSELRNIESIIRNKAAHQLTSITEYIIIELLKPLKNKDKDTDYISHLMNYKGTIKNSDDILELLRDTIKLIRDNDNECLHHDYKKLNELIKDSLK